MRRCSAKLEPQSGCSDRANALDYNFDPPVNFEEVDDQFNIINFNVCKHVGEMLQEYDFFEPEGFKNMGYFDEDE